MVRDGEVDAQVSSLLKESIFAAAARSRQCLEFCVGRALRGEVSDLKETTIAVEVFLRAADYDPKSDPIVRVHARRVREKLDQYYRTEGAGDPIRIELPKGGYVPQILRTLPTRRTEFSGWEEPFADGRIAPAVERPEARSAVPPHTFIGRPATSLRNRYLLITAILTVVALA